MSVIESVNLIPVIDDFGTPTAVMSPELNIPLTLSLGFKADSICKSCPITSICQPKLKPLNVTGYVEALDKAGMVIKGNFAGNSFFCNLLNNQIDITEEDLHNLIKIVRAQKD